VRHVSRPTKKKCQWGLEMVLGGLGGEPFETPQWGKKKPVGYICNRKGVAKRGKNQDWETGVWGYFREGEINRPLGGLKREKEHQEPQSFAKEKYTQNWKGFWIQKFMG